MLVLKCNSNHVKDSYFLSCISPKYRYKIAYQNLIARSRRKLTEGGLLPPPKLINKIQVHHLWFSKSFRCLGEALLLNWFLYS